MTNISPICTLNTVPVKYIPVKLNPLSLKHRPSEVYLRLRLNLRSTTNAHVCPNLVAYCEIVSKCYSTYTIPPPHAKGLPLLALCMHHAEQYLVDTELQCNAECRRNKQWRINARHRKSIAHVPTSVTLHGECLTDQERPQNFEIKQRKLIKCAP
jgi:hypothetical protein